MQQLARRLFLPHQFSQHLQRRNQPVARGAVVSQDHVAGLFPADVEPARPHPFQHIAIPHLRAFQRQAGAVQRSLQPQIRHDRRYNAGTAQLARCGPAMPDQRHDLVTVHDAAFFVHNDQPVGVPVQRDAQMCAARHDRFLQRGGVS